MDQIITAFGIDLRLITIQIVNFVVLLIALWYFLYTPVFKILDERKRLIAKGIEDAENAALALANADEEKGKIVTAAVAEASDIVKRGTEAGKKEKEILLREAHSQGAHILEDAEKKAHVRAREIEKKSEKEITRVAILAAEKILKERA